MDVCNTNGWETGIISGSTGCPDVNVRVRRTGEEKDRKEEKGAWTNTQVYL